MSNCSICGKPLYFVPGYTGSFCTGHFQQSVPVHKESSERFTFKNAWQDLQDDIKEWAGKTFPGPRATPALYHLLKEVKEVIKDIEEGKNPITEYADCIILLLNSASFVNIDTHQLLKAAEEKMIINKARKWGKPDENGVCQHTEE